MKKVEIIEKYKIELSVAPIGKKWGEIHGKDVSNKGLKAVLFYGKSGYAASKNRDISFDALFFHLVRNNKIECPSDFYACGKCCGSGKVHFNVDNGTCWGCNGLGYKPTEPK